MKRLNYNGRPDFSRPRKLVEDESLLAVNASLEDLVKDGVNDRTKEVDKLYGRLAKAYLKGRALKKGLSEMGRADTIPITQESEATSAAASRLDNEASKKGTVITYGLYQQAIDIVLSKKWQLRLDYLNLQVPASRELERTQTIEKRSNGSGADGLLKAFLLDNGIAATIIGMLTISPFQTIIFQGLVVEEGAKGVQLAQIPIGIALFLELGIKADKIKALLKSSNVSTPIVEDEVDRLASNPDARAEALGQAGIDYTDFKRTQEVTDAENIIQYVSDYYQRLGGLVSPGSHLTIDHWIAYFHTAQNQQSIRSALYGASTFSPKFKSFEEKTTEPIDEKGNGTITNTQTSEFSNISNQLASSISSLAYTSNNIYDDIYQSFNYQVTDQDLCCLVQIFGGANVDTEIFLTLAGLLRLVSTEYSGDINVLVDKLLSNLLNFSSDSLFDIVGQLNEFYYKAIDKLTKVFTIEIDNAPACTALFSLGWTLIEAVQVLFTQIDQFVAELLSSTGFYDSQGSSSWAVAADRRYLLSLARVLEAIADQLDLLNNCSLDNPDTQGVPRDIAQPSEAVFDIIGTPPLNLIIPEKDKKKYFTNLQPVQSKRLKFNYGTTSEQNPEDQGVSSDNSSGCRDSLSQESIKSLADNLNGALRDLFNGRS